MAHSPLMGLPSGSENDKMIHKALKIVLPRVLKLKSSNKPQPHADRVPEIILETSFAIALVVIITSLRIWLRLLWTSSFGADDVVIIPPAIGARPYLGINIATEAKGCVAEHFYDCTYNEFN